MADDTADWEFPKVKRRHKKPLTKAERREREEALQRLEAEQGFDRLEAEVWQYKLLSSLGIELEDGLSKSVARAMMKQLKKGESVEGVAAYYLADRPWKRTYVSPKQIGLMKYRGIPTDRAMCRRDASVLIDAVLSPEKFKNRMLRDMVKCQFREDLDGVARDLKLVEGVLEQRIWNALAEAGRQRREQMRSIPT